MTGGAGFTGAMRSSLRNNRKLRERNHSFRSHEMNLPSSKSRVVKLESVNKHIDLTKDKIKKERARKNIVIVGLFIISILAVLILLFV